MELQADSARVTNLTMDGNRLILTIEADLQSSQLKTTAATRPAVSPLAATQPMPPRPNTTALRDVFSVGGEIQPAKEPTLVSRPSSHTLAALNPFPGQNALPAQTGVMSQADWEYAINNVQQAKTFEPAPPDNVAPQPPEAAGYDDEELVAAFQEEVVVPPYPEPEMAANGIIESLPAGVEEFAPPLDPASYVPDLTEESTAMGGERHGEPLPSLAFGMEAPQPAAQPFAQPAAQPFAQPEPAAIYQPPPLAVPPPPAPPPPPAAMAPPPPVYTPVPGPVASQAPLAGPTGPVPGLPQIPPPGEEKLEPGSTTVLIRYTCPRCKTQGMQAVDKVGTVVNCSNCGKAMRLVMKK
jgi:hypothetical protein